MKKNITKIYGEDTNKTISGMFNNCTLMYPTLTNKQVMYINPTTDFIRVGNNSEWKDFSNWDEAADYANNKSGEFYVGVRPYKKSKAVIMATIKTV